MSKIKKKKVTRKVPVSAKPQGYWVNKENLKKGEKTIKSKEGKNLVKRNRSEYEKTITGFEWTKAELLKIQAERAKKGLLQQKAIARDISMTHRNTREAPVITASGFFNKDQWNKGDVLGVDTPPNLNMKEIKDIYKSSDLKKHILSKTKLTEKELNKLVTKKMAELGEFVTVVGALHIIEREYDVASKPKSKDKAEPDFKPTPEVKKPAKIKKVTKIPENISKLFYDNEHNQEEIYYDATRIMAYSPYLDMRMGNNIQIDLDQVSLKDLQKVLDNPTITKMDDTVAIKSTKGTYSTYSHDMIAAIKKQIGNHKILEAYIGPDQPIILVTEIGTFASAPRINEGEHIGSADQNQTKKYYETQKALRDGKKVLPISFEAESVFAVDMYDNAEDYQRSRLGTSFKPKVEDDLVKRINSGKVIRKTLQLSGGGGAHDYVHIKVKLKLPPGKTKIEHIDDAEVEFLDLPIKNYKEIFKLSKVEHKENIAEKKKRSSLYTKTLKKYQNYSEQSNLEETALRGELEETLGSFYTPRLTEDEKRKIALSAEKTLTKLNKITKQKEELASELDKAYLSTRAFEQSTNFKVRIYEKPNTYIKGTPSISGEIAAYADEEKRRKEGKTVWKHPTLETGRKERAETKANKDQLKKLSSKTDVPQFETDLYKISQEKEGFENLLKKATDSTEKTWLQSEIDSLKEREKQVKKKINAQYSKIETAATKESSILKKVQDKEIWELTKTEYNNLLDATRSNYADQGVVKPSRAYAAFKVKFDKMLKLKDDLPAKFDETWHQERTTHKDIIAKYILEGKKIPDEVMNEYPDLKDIKEWRYNTYKKDEKGELVRTEFVISKGGKTSYKGFYESSDKLIEAKLDDIDKNKARQAYTHTSWDSEKRGEEERRHYVRHVNEFHDELISKVPPERHTELKEALEQYKAKYKNKTLEQLYRRSGLASSAVVGRSNFPVSSQKKKGDVFDRKQQEFSEWTGKAQNRIRRQFGLAGGKGISSDDPTAIKQIDSKLIKLKARQAKMKIVNKIVKSKSTSDNVKRKDLKQLGYNEHSVNEFLKGDFAGRIGFPSYELANNQANIRRLKQRKEDLTNLRSQKTSSQDYGSVRIEKNIEANRLRILFDDKPSVEIRSKLKSHGFVWSPKNKAWQKMISNQADYESKEIVEEYNKTKEKSEQANISEIDKKELTKTLTKQADEIAQLDLDLAKEQDKLKKEIQNSPEELQKKLEYVQGTIRIRIQEQVRARTPKQKAIIQKKIEKELRAKERIEKKLHPEAKKLEKEFTTLASKYQPMIAKAQKDSQTKEVMQLYEEWETDKEDLYRKIEREKLKKKIIPKSKPDTSKAKAAGKNLYQEKYSPGKTHLAKTKTMTDMQKRRLIKACIDNKVDTRELDPNLKYDENQEILQNFIESKASQFHDESSSLDKKIVKLQNIYYDDFGKERVKERELDAKTTEEKVITKEDLSKNRKKTQQEKWKKEPYKSKIDVEEIDTGPKEKKPEPKVIMIPPPPPSPKTLLKRIGSELPKPYHEYGKLNFPEPMSKFDITIAYLQREKATLIGLTDLTSKDFDKLNKGSRSDQMKQYDEVRNTIWSAYYNK